MNRYILSLLIGVSLLSMQKAYAMDAKDSRDDGKTGTTPARLATAPESERPAEGVSDAAAVGAAAAAFAQPTRGADADQDSVAARLAVRSGPDDAVDFELGSGDWKSSERADATAVARAEFYDTLSPEHRAAIDRFFADEEPVFEEIRPAAAAGAGAGISTGQDVEQRNVQRFELLAFSGPGVIRQRGKNGKIANTFKLPVATEFTSSKIDFGKGARVSYHVFVEKDAKMQIGAGKMGLWRQSVRHISGSREYKDECVLRPGAEGCLWFCNMSNEPAIFTVFSSDSGIYIGEGDFGVDFDQITDLSQVQLLGELATEIEQTKGASAPVAASVESTRAAAVGAGAGEFPNGLSRYKANVLQTLNTVFQDSSSEASFLPPILKQMVVSYVQEIIKVPMLRELQDSIRLKLISRHQHEAPNRYIGGPPVMMDDHEYEISVVINGEKRKCERNLKLNQRTTYGATVKPEKLTVSHLSVWVNKMSGFIELYFYCDIFSELLSYQDILLTVSLATMPMRYDPHTRCLFEEPLSR